MSPNKEDIIIAGIAMIPVREHWDQTLQHLAFRAMREAQESAGGLRPQALYVANTLAGSLSGQAQLGALLADFAGLNGIEAHSVEAAGASGGVALRQAYLALKAGELDTALVVGVEKVSDKPTAEVEAALMSAADTDYEAVQGLTRTAQAALLMRRYFHEFEVPEGGLAGFPLTAHANAVHNPNAMFRRAIKRELYARGTMISEPVTMFDAAPLADGAAAVLLARESILPDPAAQPEIRIAASAVATAPLALHDQDDPLTLETARLSTETVYRRAGLDAERVDLFELHDLFSIHAALALEAAGFAERGAGWRLASDGNIGLEGRIPICTFGGSKARGDTAGATGLYQAVEATLQLQERAGDNQVTGAEIGLIQCLGGNGATCATHLLQRR